MALEHREPFLVVQDTLPLQSCSCPVGPHLRGWKGVTVRDTSAPSVSGLPCYSCCDNILMSVRPKHTLFSCHSQEKKAMFTCSQEAYTPGSQHSLPPNKCQLILKFSESTKHVRWISRNSPYSRMGWFKSSQRLTGGTRVALRSKKILTLFRFWLNA